MLLALAELVKDNLISLEEAARKADMELEQFRAEAVRHPVFGAVRRVLHDGAVAAYGGGVR